MQRLSVIGLSHRTAPVAMRERFALSPEQTARLLARLHAGPALEEALLLSTCNRTELYAVAAPHADPADCLLQNVARVKAADAASLVPDPAVFYRRAGADAVRHLFRVAASLDSQIVGEREILGQVKRAYRLAVEARTAGFFINKLLHWAFRVGKRVQAETDLGRGSAGVAPAAVELAAHIFSSLAGKTVLLVGAGATAENAARALLRAGAGHLIVANRTLYRAEELAQQLRETRNPEPGQCGMRSAECGVNGGAPGPFSRDPTRASQRSGDAASQSSKGSGLRGAGLTRAELATDVTTEAIGLEDLAPAVMRADLVITSTASDEPVLKYEDLAPTLVRLDHPLVIIDIAVPRDVDLRIGRVPNVFLYNLDDLDRLVARNIERRLKEIPRAEAIVDYEVGRFQRWLDSREVVPTIRLLQEHFARLRTEELRQHGPAFTSTEREQLARFTEHLCGRILHGPIALLRESAETGSLSEGLAIADAIRRMFNLDALDDTDPGDEPPSEDLP